MEEFKNPKQIEFSQLAAKAKQLGLNAARIAEKLHISAASVSGYLSGAQTPQDSKIELLRRIIDEIENPIPQRNFDIRAGLNEMGDDLTEAQEMLREIHDSDPHESFKVVKEVISTYRKVARRGPRVEEPRRVLEPEAKPKPPVASGLPADIGERVSRASAAADPRRKGK